MDVQFVYELHSEGSWTHVYIADVFASLTTEMSSAVLLQISASREVT